jgi:hypothetical protein
VLAAWTVTGLARDAELDGFRAQRPRVIEARLSRGRMALNAVRAPVDDTGRPAGRIDERVAPVDETSLSHQPDAWIKLEHLADVEMAGPKKSRLRLMTIRSDGFSTELWRTKATKNLPERIPLTVNGDFRMASS